MVEIAGCGERWARVERTRAKDWNTAVDALRQVMNLIARHGSSLRWSEETCALRVEQSSARAPAIRVASLTLVILDNDDQLMKTMPLAGASQKEVADWLSSQRIEVAAMGQESGTLPAPRQVDLANLERSLSNAHHMLSQIARRTQGAEPVRTDVDSLETYTRIPLGTRVGELQRSISVGFALGGEQGELFVRTHPETESAPPAALPLAEVVKQSDADAQARMIEKFVTDALAGAYARLSREWRPRTSAPT